MINHNPANLQPSAPPSWQLEAIDRQIERIQESSLTLGEYVERVFVEVLRPVSGADYPLLQDERFGRRVVRYCKPWPEWVLRISVEVLTVRFPTIKKQTLLDCSRLLHFLAVEARLDGSNMADAPPLPAVNDRFMGAVAGHLLAHCIAASQSQPDPQKLVRTVNELQKQFVPLLAGHFKDFPEGFLDFNAALAEARATTFDKAGNHKATPLTPVYRKILSGWPEIEYLSGPKALTEYLSPLLGNQDFEDKYARVKMICSRFQIKFLPSVK